MFKNPKIESSVSETRGVLGTKSHGPVGAGWGAHTVPNTEISEHTGMGITNSSVLRAVGNTEAVHHSALQWKVLFMTHIDKVYNSVLH